MDHFCRRVSPPLFHFFFAQFFNLLCFPDFFPTCVKFKEFVFFSSGEFHEWRQNASV